jgi:hypothetical protein
MSGGSTATTPPVVTSEPGASLLNIALPKEMEDRYEQTLRNSGNLAFFVSYHTLVLLKHNSALQAAHLLQFGLNQQQQKTGNKPRNATQAIAAANGSPATPSSKM